MWYKPPKEREQEPRDVAPQPRTAGAIPVEYKRAAIFPQKGDVVLPSAKFEQLMKMLESIKAAPSINEVNITVKIDSERNIDMDNVMNKLNEAIERARKPYGV